MRGKGLMWGLRVWFRGQMCVLSGVTELTSRVVRDIKWVLWGSSAHGVQPKERELWLSPSPLLLCSVTQKSYRKTATLYLQKPDQGTSFQLPVPGWDAPTKKGEPRRHWSVSPHSAANWPCDRGQGHQLCLPQGSHLWNGNSPDSLHEGQWFNEDYRWRPRCQAQGQALGITSEEDKVPASVQLTFQQIKRAMSEHKRFLSLHGTSHGVRGESGHQTLGGSSLTPQIRSHWQKPTSARLFPCYYRSFQTCTKDFEGLHLPYAPHQWPALLRLNSSHPLPPLPGTISKRISDIILFTH